MDCILGQDITIDLRAIWDPQGAQQLKHCTGRNGTIQLRLLMMQEFRDIIFSCKSLCEHAAETRQPLNLGLFCNSGRHRSVALGELLSEYLGDYLTTKVQHLTLFNPCGCPGDCINYHGKIDPRAEDPRGQACMTFLVPKTQVRAFFGRIGQTGTVGVATHCDTA